MRYYIGLDAHSTTSTFAVVDENGQCVLRETVKTSEQSLIHVISKIQGERHMTFEDNVRKRASPKWNHPQKDLMLV